jgi:hypothetical protein
MVRFRDAGAETDDEFRARAWRASRRRGPSDSRDSDGAVASVQRDRDVADPIARSEGVKNTKAVVTR